MIVLIAEDDKWQADLWERWLNNVACAVRRATTVEEAEVAMRELPHPDIVLLDLTLSGNGSQIHTLESIATLKEINPKAVVIVLTGSIEEELPALAHHFGADWFTTKHAEANSQRVLLNALHSAIDGRTKRTNEPLFSGALDALERLNSLTRQT